MTKQPTLVCRDCKALGLPLTRKAKRPGPRCAEHARARRKALSEARWGARILSTYGITPEEYWALYEAQGGKCYLCQRATGARKRLAVDHDHATGFVRGLLCSPCNKILGHARDEQSFFLRAVAYLNNPPAFDLIGRRKP